MDRSQHACYYSRHFNRFPNKALVQVKKYNSMAFGVNETKTHLGLFISWPASAENRKTNHKTEARKTSLPLRTQTGIIIRDDPALFES